MIGRSILAAAMLWRGVTICAVGQAEVDTSPSAQVAVQKQGDQPSQAGAGVEASEDEGKIPRLKPVTPLSRSEIDLSVARGIEFLLKNQNKNGSWGNATQTKDLNIFAPVPGAHEGFRAATTALCLTALYDAGKDRKDVQQSLDRAEAWMFSKLAEVRRADGVAIYNVWAHCYSLQALARMHDRHADEETRRKIRKLVELQFEMLSRYESVDGGWGYYDMRYQTKQPSSDSISFVNAAVLVAFKEIQDRGFSPPEKLVKRAIAATERQRLEDFSYLYGEYLKWQPRRGINRPAGSLGRSQACNLALRQWGNKEITTQVLKDWLDRLFARNGWLDIGRKRPIPHEAWFQVAGYFYYFGHYYGTLCILELPPEERGEYFAHMSRLLISKQEKDGSWWDFPFYSYHQPYGTAFAVLSLVRCRE